MIGALTGFYISGYVFYLEKIFIALNIFSLSVSYTVPPTGLQFVRQNRRHFIALLSFINFFVSFFNILVSLFTNK